MAKSILAIPEENLLEFINIIVVGLRKRSVTADFKAYLADWCNEEWNYIKNKD